MTTHLLRCIYQWLTIQILFIITIHSALGQSPAWATRIGADAHAGIEAITSDETYLYAVIDIDGTSYQFSDDATGTLNIDSGYRAIVRYDLDGNYIDHVFMLAQDHFNGGGISITGYNTLLITGSFYGDEINFSGVAEETVERGGFVAEYTMTLELIRYRLYAIEAGSDVFFSNHVTNENDEIFICGDFNGTWGDGVTSISAYGNDGFLLRLNSDFETLALQDYGDDLVDEIIYFLSIDADNNIYMFGNMDASSSLYPGFPLLENKGEEDCFVIKANPEGVPVWIHHIASTKDDIIEAILYTGGKIKCLMYTEGDSIYLNNELSMENTYPVNTMMVNLAPDGTLLNMQNVMSSEGSISCNSIVETVRGTYTIDCAITGPTILHGAEDTSINASVFGWEYLLLELDELDLKKKILLHGTGETAKCWYTAQTTLQNGDAIGGIRFWDDTLSLNDMQVEELYDDKYTYLITKVSGLGTVVHSIENRLPVVLYPNPSSDILFIDLPEGSVPLVSVYTINGEHANVGIVTTLPDQLMIETGRLPEGIYFVRLQWNEFSSFHPFTHFH